MSIARRITAFSTVRMGHFLGRLLRQVVKAGVFPLGHVVNTAKLKVRPQDKSVPTSRPHLIPVLRVTLRLVLDRVQVFNMLVVCINDICILELHNISNPDLGWVCASANIRCTVCPN